MTRSIVIFAVVMVTACNKSGVNITIENLGKEVSVPAGKQFNVEFSECRGCEQGYYRYMPGDSAHAKLLSFESIASCSDCEGGRSDNTYTFDAIGKGETRLSFRNQHDTISFSLRIK
jgi:hypothetical protein